MSVDKNDIPCENSCTVSQEAVANRIEGCTKKRQPDIVLDADVSARLKLGRSFKSEMVSGIMYTKLVKIRKKQSFFCLIWFASYSIPFPTLQTDTVSTKPYVSVEHQI